MRLTRIRLLVGDFPRAFRFYREVVGLTATLGEEDGVYVEFAVGDAILALFDRRRMMEALGTHASILAAPERVGDAAVLSLEVDDLDAEVTRLQGAGVRFVTEPHDQPTWRVRVAHFRDPDGNLIELNRPLEQETA
jgi:catechol 2,3-dioxygenase-like lactoylglutathione lyase family enzyme